MATYEVETDLIVHCKIKLAVLAGDKQGAIDFAAELLPSNAEPEQSKRWRADVTLKPPSPVKILACKAYHFEQASGSDKARKIAD